MKRITHGQNPTLLLFVPRKNNIVYSINNQLDEIRAKGIHLNMQEKIIEVQEDIRTKVFVVVFIVLILRLKKVVTIVAL